MPWNANGDWYPDPNAGQYDPTTNMGNSASGGFGPGYGPPTPPPAQGGGNFFGVDPQAQTAHAPKVVGTDHDGNPITDAGTGSNQYVSGDVAFQYGGYAGGAQDFEDRMRADQAWAQSRGAPQIDQQAYGLARDAMQGNAPSAATTQMGMGVGQGTGSELASMNATSGGRFNTKAGMMGGVTGAAGQGAQAQTQAVGQGSMGRAEEIGTARGQFGGLAAQNLQAHGQQAAMNDALMNQYLAGETGVAQEQLQARMNERGAANQIGMNQEQYQVHPYTTGMSVLGKWGSGFTAAGTSGGDGGGMMGGS
jgi:hypothetical protein